MKTIQPLGRPEAENPPQPTLNSQPPEQPQNPNVISGSFVQETIGQPSTGTETSDSNKKKWIIISAAGVASFILLIGLGAFIILNNDDFKSKETKNTSLQTPEQGPTAFEKKLTPSQLDQLNSIKMPIYLPVGMSIDNVVIQNNKSTGKSMLTYGHNTKFGQGLTKGTYGFTIYPITDNFNPPADCALVGGDKASDPMSCSFYDKSDKDLPAFVYSGRNPYSTQNTSGGSPITMYAKKDDTIIAVSTVSTSASEIYAIIKSMDKYRPVDLPEDSMVMFSNRP